MIKHFVRHIRRSFYGLFKPKMIVGYRRKSDNVFLPKTRISNSTFIDSPNKLDIKDNVFIGHHNFIEASNHISIGEGCQITNFITITTHSSHDSIRLYGSESPRGNVKGYLRGRVSIGKFTFIGPHVTIMPNTIIGKGCIVSAYSMVQGDFPDFSILKGNPAKIVGDTRERDKILLNEYPEMKEMYIKWVENE